jgi:predicted DNA-binding ribbon-helix-helix protein
MTLAKASPSGDEPGRMRKHSLVIAGHSTSISLEASFWDALRELARERSLSVAALVAEIDQTRGAANLSSALRVHILQVFRDGAVRK